MEINIFKTRLIIVGVILFILGIIIFGRYVGILPLLNNYEDLSIGNVLYSIGELFIFIGLLIPTDENNRKKITAQKESKILKILGLFLFCIIPLIALFESIFEASFFSSKFYGIDAFLFDLVAYSLVFPLETLIGFILLIKGLLLASKHKEHKNF